MMPRAAHNRRRTDADSVAPPATAPWSCPAPMGPMYADIAIGARHIDDHARRYRGLVRLATFNVQHGRSLDDGLVDPDRFRAAVAALDADVVGLQEVDLDQPRSDRLDLTALAAEAVGAADHRCAAAVVGTPGETWRPAGTPPADGEPQYGVALVSRFPVRRWLVQRLPPAPTRAPIPVGGRVMLLPDEPRVLLAGVLDTPGGPVTAATTHLSFVPGWNVRQLRR